MKKFFPLILLLALCAGCSPKKTSDKPILAVSTPAQAQILSELADTLYNIVTVLPPGTNPETYDPAMKERMALADARAFFITGVLPFEQTLNRGLPDQVEIIDTSKGIDLITGTHQHAHNHDGHTHHDGADHHDGDVDPHISTSYANALIMAQNFTDALSRLDPDRAVLYTERLQGFTSRIRAAQDLARDRLQQAGAHAFAVWHPSLSYFARDFDLHQISVGQESKEISITSLSKIVEEARADSVRVFFYQKAYDSRQAENVNSAIGSRLVAIDPLDADWESQLNLIIDALTSDN